MRRILLLLTAAMLISVSSAFAADPVPVTNIILKENSVTLAVGKTLAEKPTVEPKNATDKSLNWYSSDEKVAVVKEGRITAKQEGSAVITAEAADGSGVTASMEVRVVIPAEKIILSVTDQLSLPEAYAWRLTAQVEPEDVTIRELIWSSSDERIVTVNEYGTVTAVSPGSAVVTVEAADGCGAKAALKVRVEKFDMIFESMEPQRVEYEITVGSHRIRGKVKTGCISIDELDYSITILGAPNSDRIDVTPVKAGADVLTITGSGKDVELKVFVSPTVFPESGAAPLTEGDRENAEILVLRLPWSTSLPEAQRILESQGKKLKSPVQRNDYLRAMIEGEVAFANCTATRTALDFSYTQGMSNYRSVNNLFRGVFYFDPKTSFEQIRLAVRSVYGLDEGEAGEDSCVWKKDDIQITLTRKEKYTALEIEQTATDAFFTE